MAISGVLAADLIAASAAWRGRPHTIGITAASRPANSGRRLRADRRPSAYPAPAAATAEADAETTNAATAGRFREGIAHLLCSGDDTRL
jgi:hypothetical protein